MAKPTSWRRLGAWAAKYQQNGYWRTSAINPLKVPETRNKNRLKLLHTADVHIGDDNDAAWRLSAFEAVIDAAIVADVDAVLIAGDLFDSVRVGKKDLEATLVQLARLALPVFVTPGNHDCLGPPSIYSKIKLSDAGSHVHFLDDPSGSSVTLADLSLSVWARALVEHHPSHDPLAGYSRPRDGNWQIAMAHGHFVPTGQPVLRSSPIREEDISLMDCDYLALGHWHVFQRINAGTTVASYPGSPSEAAGTFAGVNLVTLDPKKGVTIERIELPRNFKHQGA